MVQQASRILWRVGQVFAEGNSATFKLKPGNYVAELVAVRKLSFKAYCRQRHVNSSNPIPLAGLSGTTNRTFDETGNETNGTGNSASAHPATNWPSACSARARFHRKTIGTSSSFHTKF